MKPVPGELATIDPVGQQRARDSAETRAVRLVSSYVLRAVTSCEQYGEASHPLERLQEEPVVNLLVAEFARAGPPQLASS